MTGPALSSQGLGIASVTGVVVQTIGLVLLAPFLLGAMRQVRARLEGRVGAGVAQPWRDLRKLAGKEDLRPSGTTIVFRAGPWVLLGTTLMVVAVGPFLSTTSPLDQYADLFAVVSLLLLGTVAMALAGLDTGTAFGGMGASREMVVLALVEPTILLSTFALSVRVGSTNLGAIVGSTLDDPQQVVFPASLLALVALVVVVIAEAGRMPVDNPSTHLELTMIHEAMVLEYAGPDLALVEWASAMRLTVLLGLLSNLFVPWGIAGDSLAMLPVGVAAIAAKVAVAGAALAAAEVFMAKLRMFRVPELLAGSFVLALFAVASSFFLVAP
jgi:formate hydrogenlyase subunit 4